MNCPDCNEEYKCPCASCKPGNGSKWEYVRDSEYQKCPGCNVSKHLEEWFEIQMRQYENEKDRS